MALADLLADLDPEQQEVATSIDQPVCVLAGAGTGKTRAITHRIAYAVHSGQADANKSMALTFTTRAADELRARLATLGVGDVQARTFHSAALRQLRYFWPRVEAGELPKLVPGKATYAAPALRNLGISESLLAPIVAEIEWAKVSLVMPEEYPATAIQRDLPAPAEQIAEVYRVYEALKAGDAAMDFEDVLLVITGMIAENSAVCEQVRSQYRHFTVDEYQDVSPIQQQLLDLWIGDSRDVCVVGDPQQTIYSFAGASSDFLHAFAEDRRAQVIRLFRDYRSTPEIVEFANRLVPIEHHLVGQQPAGSAPEVIMVAENEPAVIADRVRAGIAEGFAPDEIAVLFRTNAQAEGFARMLSSRGISASVRRDESESDRGGVTVASLHAAKGLEWDLVIIGGVIEGLLPISYATTDAAVAEEKRLFYVGVTRARRRLIITYQGQRSRFLDQVAVTEAPARPEVREVSIAICRHCNKPLRSAVERKRQRCEDCPGEPDPLLLQRLRTWRASTASAASTPEFVVATDASLEALAEVRPDTLSSLREVVGARVAATYGQELLALLTGTEL